MSNDKDDRGRPHACIKRRRRNENDLVNVVEMYRATTGWFFASQSSPRSPSLRSRCTFKSAVVVNYL